MNEQIYKIARQADALAREIEPDLREIVRYNHIRDEKFAEMIVRESAHVALMSNGNNLHVCELIKQHFGVEE